MIHKEPQFGRKCIILFIFLIILLINIAEAVTINNNGSNITRFKPSSTTGWITLANGSFSYLNISSAYLSINTSYKFNSNANITLSNITHSSDKLNFTGNATSGTFNMLLKMANNSYRYALKVDNVFNFSSTSNSSGWVSFNYSSWSQHDFYIRGNSPITIANISDTYSLNTGDTLRIYPTYSDTDGDTPTFARDFTNGTFYTNNGTLLWTTIASDSGVKTWTINVTDGYGSIASKTFYISTNSTIPTVPYNITNTTVNFWVNHTWLKGLNTNSFNLSHNGTWVNGSAINFTNNSVGAHGYQNITVCGYNTTVSQIGACATQNTSVPDNLPTYGATSLSRTSMVTTDTVDITINNVADADSDTLTVIAGITLQAGGVEVNYTMVNTANTSDYTYTFSTGTTGTYTVTHFYINNAYGNTTKADTLQFTVSTPVSVSSGGNSGGGGGGGNIIIVNDSAPSIAFKSITDFRSTEEIKQLGECLSESILLPNKCTSGKIVTAIISNIANWWILAAAYIMSFFTVLGLAIANQRPRQYIQDSLLYGTLTIVIILFLQLMGFNLYLVNYMFNNPAPGLMSASIASWSLIVSIIADNITYKKKSFV